MPFVSYAENLEDVVLRRALGAFGPGFYIDVGAYDPIRASVTWAFYQRGWRGINIEPAPETFGRLASVRTEDFNLRVLLGAEAGEAILHLIDGESGFSTMDPEIAAHHRIKGHSCREISVQVTTLADVCARYVTGPVHFLKIDVEGAELAVLQGADFSRWRPWVVLLEATYPGTTEPSYAMWEPELLRAGYKFVYFDVLNRFYVADERLSELGQAFAVPPSAFDGYITAQEQAALDAVAARDLQIVRLQASIAELDERIGSHRCAERRLDRAAIAVRSRRDAAEQRAQSAAHALGRAEHEISELRTNLGCLTKRCEDLGRENVLLREIMARRSWRMTARLRAVGQLLRIGLGKAHG